MGTVSQRKWQCLSSICLGRAQRNQQELRQQCEQTQTGMRDPCQGMVGEGLVDRGQKKTREEDMGWVGRALMAH